MGATASVSSRPTSNGPESNDKDLDNNVFSASAKKRAAEISEAKSSGKHEIRVPSEAQVAPNDGDDHGEAKSEYDDDERTIDEKNLDNFAADIMKTVNGVEAFDSIMASSSGQTALLNFLKGEYADENLQFYLDTFQAKEAAKRNYLKPAAMLVETYLQSSSETPVSISPEIREKLSNLLTEDETFFGDSRSQAELDRTLTEAQKEVRTMLCLAALPRFLESKYFEDWKSEHLEANRMVMGVSMSRNGSENLLKAMEAPSSTTANTSGKGASTSAGGGAESGAKKEGENKKNLKMSKELKRILTHNAWLRTLLGTFETMPVCVSVAAASQSLRGFPLVYVNKFFEEVTGYHRSEIIGKNCSFLQKGKKPTDKSDPEVIKKISRALREGKPLKVLITNYTREGVQFNNLLALKPIFDEVGDYAFVVGMQFNCGHATASRQRLMLLDRFFTMLPMRVPHMFSNEEMEFLVENFAVPW